MSSVMVFVKRNGLLVACRPAGTQDGAQWHCPHCETIVIRASFGVMNGVLQCPCGAEVEINVDGVAVEVESLNVLRGSPPLDRPDDLDEELNQPVRRGRTRRKKKMTDEDFLRECGIATKEETENA